MCSVKHSFVVFQNQQWLCLCRNESTSCCCRPALHICKDKERLGLQIGLAPVSCSTKRGDRGCRNQLCQPAAAQPRRWRIYKSRCGPFHITQHTYPGLWDQGPGAKRGSRSNANLPLFWCIDHHVGIPL
ncbi:hypothetical protein VTK26DRAFT_7344 [Humicola hyalothermophila]